MKRKDFICVFGLAQNMAETAEEKVKDAATLWKEIFLVVKLLEDEQTWIIIHMLNIASVKYEEVTFFFELGPHKLYPILWHRETRGNNVWAVFPLWHPLLWHCICLMQ